MNSLASESFRHWTAPGVDGTFLDLGLLSKSLVIWWLWVQRRESLRN